VVEYPPDLVRALAEAGAATDPGTALPMWKQIREQYGDIEGALLREASCLRKVGSLEDAKVLYEVALRKWPSSEGALAGLAELAAFTEDWPAAKRYWSIYRDAYPNNFWAHYWLAVTPAKLGSREASANLLEPLSKDDRWTNEKPTVLYRLAETYLEMNNPERALTFFKELVAIGKTEKAWLDRLAWWIIRVTLDAPGFPCSVFALDPILVSFARVPKPA
jgi:tetratricopeptide (TPR) repeat protein